MSVLTFFRGMGLGEFPSLSLSFPPSLPPDHHVCYIEEQGADSEAHLFSTNFFAVHLLKDYLESVQEPMDFSTVYHTLDNNMYVDPEAFVRDVRLIFSNSRTYNTIPRSRVSIVLLLLLLLLLFCYCCHPMQFCHC